jgi:hypothetical protein
MEWPNLKRKLEMRVENCEGLDSMKVRWWRNVISRLSDLVGHCEDNFLLSFLISVNIIDKETKEFIGTYLDGKIETKTQVSTPKEKNSIERTHQKRDTFI